MGAGTSTTGFPPSASTAIILKSGPAYTIRPSASQTALGSANWALSATSTGVPPATATLYSLAPAKKPSHRPSGEKNGASPPSVPGSSRASRSPRSRTASRVTVSPARVTNAMRDPSRAIAREMP